MSKSPLFIMVVMLLGFVAEGRAQVKNERAKQAAAAYKNAVNEARETYIKELEQAIKEAGGAGDLEEANRLAAEKEALEQHGNPMDQAAQRLENTRWVVPGNRKGFLRFLKGNRTVNHQGMPGVWILSDKNTAITQSQNSGNIYVFQFDEKLTTATVHTFEDAKKPRTYLKR